MNPNPLPNKLCSKILATLLIVTWVMSWSCGFSSIAYAAQDEGAGVSTFPKEFGAKAQAATIIYSGLGGAVLGLSTLSFYGRPEEHLSNIAVGFALGVIAGTSYVTFFMADNWNYSYKDQPSNRNYILSGFRNLRIGTKWEF